MSYRSDKEKKRELRNLVLLLSFIVVVLFTPFTSALFTTVESWSTAAWVRSGKNLDETRSFLANLGGKQALREENQELRDEVNRLQVDNLRTTYLESVLAGYESLHQEVVSGEGIISTTILARGTQTPRGTFLIDAGVRDGVMAGDEVIAYNNVSIARVVETFDFTSRVELKSRGGVITQGILYPGDEVVNLVGYGNGYQAEFLRDSEVAVGDVVYAQETPGRILAVVQEIVYDPRNPFKQVYLSVPINLDELSVVGVVTK